MGCIVCPLSGSGGEEDRDNLLETGERVRFYNLKNGDGEEARYSRQTIEGIRFPTDLSACPERWPDVAAEIALCAWKGGSIIAVGTCKSKYRGNMVDKVMMCHKCRPYKSESAQQALPAPPPSPTTSSRISPSPLSTGVLASFEIFLSPHHPYSLMSVG
jgi:hypothetical protein